MSQEYKCRNSKKKNAYGKEESDNNTYQEQISLLYISGSARELPPGRLKQNI